MVKKKIKGGLNDQILKRMILPVSSADMNPVNNILVYIKQRIDKNAF